MSFQREERRESRVTVQELRRQLRDADEDRYLRMDRLAQFAKDRSSSGGSIRTLAIILAVTAGIGSAVSIADAPAPGPTSIATHASAIRFAPLATPGEIVSIRRAHQTAPARSSTTVERKRRATPVASFAKTPAKDRRPVPRPVSPGEFGRTAPVKVGAGL
jgi:hypothetical protein